MARRPVVRDRPTPCGRLGQDQAHGPVDVCKLEPGHDGPHEGRYRGMVWEDVPSKPARARVHRPGSITAQIPDTGANIRGDR